MIRDETARAMLLDLDNAVQGLRKEHGDTEHVVSLTGLYHNLVRRWAEA
jgi:PKHD-type hydroxylase